MKHVHADLIVAWANGAEIEVLIPSAADISWHPLLQPRWNELGVYRIKPQPKPNAVTWHGVFKNLVTGGYADKQGVADFYADAFLLRLEIDHNDPTNPVLVSATLEKP
jgi:hypothetical protein